MKKSFLLATLGVLLLPAFSFAAGPASPSPAVKVDASQILHQMSDTLGAAKEFTFKAKRNADPALAVGANMPENALVTVSVMRPDKIMATAVSKQGGREVYFNGKTLTLVDTKMNLYSTVPMRTNLDGLPDKLDEQYGFTPPLADFAVSNIYKDLQRQADRFSYLGETSLARCPFDFCGVKCYRIALAGKVADAELWVGVNDHLPYKLVATFKDRPGKPQLRIAFSSWNLDAKLSASQFTYVPSKGATKISMVTTAEMESAAKKKH